MRYLLADPELSTRSGGEEFARVVAASPPGEDVAVTLHASLPTTFPLAETRPRYTVRHLLKVAVPPDDPAWYVREAPRGGHQTDPGAGLDFESTHESGLTPVMDQVGLTEMTASVPVPAALVHDAALLAAFVDHRVIVRLGTIENQILLHGTDDRRIEGLLNLDGLRAARCTGDLAADVAEVAADVEDTGGSCDGIVVHPRMYWEFVVSGLLGQLSEVGVRVARTRMIPPDQALFGDFRAAVTLLDPLESTLALRHSGDPVNGQVIEARTRVGLAVHLPQHFVLMK